MEHMEYKSACLAVIGTIRPRLDWKLVQKLGADHVGHPLSWSSLLLCPGLVWWKTAREHQCEFSPKFTVMKTSFSKVNLGAKPSSFWPGVVMVCLSDEPWWTGSGVYAKVWLVRKEYAQPSCLFLILKNSPSGYLSTCTPVLEELWSFNCCASQHGQCSNGSCSWTPSGSLQVSSVPFNSSGTEHSSWIGAICPLVFFTPERLGNS